MPVSLTDIAAGFLAPAIFAAVVMVVSHRLLSEKLARRCTATVALVGAFTLSYALLGWLDLVQWKPKFAWHWLPYVVLATLPVGPLLTAPGKQRWAGIALMLVVAALGGWLLVPTWPHLEPSRAVHMAVWIPAVFALALLLEPLAQRPADEKTPVAPLPRGLLIATLTASMFCAVIVILLSGRLTFAQLAAAAAAALLGILGAVLLDRKAYGIDGIAPAYSMLIAGLLLIARVDSHSSVPLLSYVLLPLAPLTLWVAALKPLRKFQSWRSWLVLFPLPLALLIASLLLAVVAEFGTDQSY